MTQNGNVKKIPPVYVTQQQLDLAIDTHSHGLEFISKVDTLTANKEIPVSYNYYHYTATLDGSDVNLDLDNLEYVDKNIKIIILINGSVIGGVDRDIVIRNGSDLTIDTVTIYDGGADNVYLAELYWDYTLTAWILNGIKNTVMPPP